VAQNEVAMDDRFAEAPSFEEYVTARGADLLRTAWLLVGDDRRAQDLVRSTLARSWPQWHHLSEVGAGSYDAELRRSLLRTYLRRGLLRRDGADHPTPTPASASSTPTRAHVLAVLDGLPRRGRAALVLWGLDQLSDAQIADALDDDVPAVHRRRLQALATVGGRLALDEDGLRAVLAGLPPQDPPIQGLLDPTRSYAAGLRGARGWALGVAGLVAAGVVVGVASRDGGGGDAPTPTATARPTTLACRDSFGPPSPPLAPSGQLSRTVTAVLVCAQTDEGSVWAGSLPPDEPVTVPLALDALSLQPRTNGAGCADLPQGPAFRMVLRRNDGSTTTYANEGLACNGWPALASYYVALAEQGAAPVSEAAPESDPGASVEAFLGCPSILGKTVSPPGVAPPGHPGGTKPPAVVPPGLPRGTVLEAATACLHPRPILNAVPRFRAIRSNVMGAPELAELNADLAKGGSSGGPGSTCTRGTSLFVVRARTAEGRLVELSSACADRFAVDWNQRDSWPVSARTRDMLRALMVVVD
jgi:DNA-directed RNA polymerase specialized sigma24 family protein